jgi:DNA gyrase inhibitor GyrI
MVVEFRIKSVPKFRVASITRVGPWRRDNLRTEFRELTSWAQKRHVRTGKWIFLERSAHRWDACLQIFGKAQPEGRIRLKMLPATTAATVVFDPDQVSSSVVYHGLRDWTHWRKKDGTIKGVSATREIYQGDPWSDKDAWSHCEVQFLVRT